MRSSRNLAQLGASLVLLGFLAYGRGAWAQEVPSASAQDDFEERVDVEVVSVDVIATDREKERVLDLTKDDFELLVDGRPVRIDYFAAPHSPAPPALADEGIPSLAIAPAPAPAPSAPTNLIFYIDQTALENADRQRALAGLREFLRSRAEGADRVTVASFEQRLKVVLPPTTDREAIAKALDQVEERPSLASLGSRERAQLERDIRELATYPRDPRELEQEIENLGRTADGSAKSVARGAWADGPVAGHGRRAQGGGSGDRGDRVRAGAVSPRRAGSTARRLFHRRDESQPDGPTSRPGTSR